MTERDEIDRASDRDARMACETVRGQLIQRNVQLDDDETPEQLTDLLTG